ncbi:putative lipoprotein [Gordonia spumicola]|uniref:Putative lipoprotein n=1 Tax=Gordonia spumicola TaxID=589161 RepID=A0A7I9VBD2_9ACTN|nr:ABC transporter substrate-binding protein [Gordonia spumicola]GEE02686.1 putative lipoprotein [Gordonia spumicola]
MIGPRLRRVAALTAALAAAGTLLVACGDDEKSSVDYLVDARVRSLNVNTRDGYADGALMALTRVLPGFSYIGPQGQTVADRDIGTATLQESSPMTVRYEFSADAVYSDGHAMTCDDLLLAATAMGGRVAGFDAATHAGYQDIDKVDCAPGARSATVTFRQGASYGDWAGLFGAGTLLPAHVVGRIAGVADVHGAITGKDAKALGKIADAWNTGFALAPGREVDKDTILSSGPYRVESYSTDEGLRLVANDKWWGGRPALGDVTVWTAGTNGAGALADGRVDVVDSADLSAADTLAGRAAVTDRGSARDAAPLSVTSLVFAGRGVVADALVRRALASCMPRNQLARAHGANGIVWNLRSAAPADTLGPSLNVQFGRRYPRSDAARARALLDQRPIDTNGRRPKPVIRIGYPAGSTVDKAVVDAVAASCVGAGITVRDVSSPDFSVAALGKDADAVLMSGDTFAASGSASGVPALYALYPGDPLNLSGFRDVTVRNAVNDIVATTSDSARLPLLRTIDTQAWDQLPSIPLFGTVRGREYTGVSRVVPGLGRSGTGWNMDRWGAAS